MIARCRELLALFLLLAGSSLVLAQQGKLDYQLRPQQLAAGVYLLQGSTEDFSVSNGGNIVNTGFIVGSEGVIVIDSGPSRRYGEQLRAAIAAVTPLPVVMVINTHHHPDHVFGNQAFDAAALAALEPTRAALEAEGDSLLDNMYRLNGAWMQGTEVVLPARRLSAGRLEVGGRVLELHALNGHTAADLVVLDVDTGVLFASDLVFSARAPTTPHAELESWLGALQQLEQIAFTWLVPGHGAPARDGAPIEQTRAYLHWLAQTLHDGAEQGLDLNEMMDLELPARFDHLAGARTEYRRSVIHLYPALEQQALRRM